MSFVAILWGLLVGLVFSLIGAAGGILSSFGLIAILDVSDPNTVKPMAQVLTLAAALVFIPGYYKRSAIVLPLAILLAAGGIIGAWVGSTLSSLYLSDMSTFKPWFGLLTLLISIQMAWKLFQSSQQETEQKHCSAGISEMSFSWKQLSFRYGDQLIKCATWFPFVTGAGIALLASAFGVGGGFLLVPYMHSILRMPMYIIPATAALAIFASGSVSIFNYIRMGSELDYSLLSLLVIGAIVGAVLGPKINAKLKSSWLTQILIVILFAIGVKYIMS